jgi:hypothetical protein
MNQISRSIALILGKKTIYALITALPQYMLFIVIFLLDNSESNFNLSVLLIVSNLAPILVLFYKTEIASLYTTKRYEFEFKQFVQNAVQFALNMLYPYVVYRCLPDIWGITISDLSVVLIFISLSGFILTVYAPLLIVENDRNKFKNLLMKTTYFSFLLAILIPISNNYLKIYDLETIISTKLMIFIIFYIVGEILFRLVTSVLLKFSAYGLILIILSLRYFILVVGGSLSFIIALSFFMLILTFTLIYAVKKLYV